MVHFSPELSLKCNVYASQGIYKSKLNVKMPERVHTRLDGGVVSQTEVVSRRVKRKREHGEETHRREDANPPDRGLSTSRSSRDHSQRSNGSDCLESAPSTIVKSKGPPEQFDRLFNDKNRLKDRAKSLETARKTLPIWSHAKEVRDALREKDVMLLVGETGSGKSTQVPQMLVEEPWCRPRVVPTDGSHQSMKVGGCIAVTEPRKVAAITLARRVAEEMGTPLGSSSPKSTVGYSVRFDQSTSPNTKIKFLTEGMLLQEMLRDPWLKAYSAVFVDEVHERGVNVDLLLGFLRNMVVGKNEGRGGVPLKVGVGSNGPFSSHKTSYFSRICSLEWVSGLVGHLENDTLMLGPGHCHERNLRDGSSRGIF